MLSDILSACSQVLNSGDKQQLRNLEQFQHQFNIYELKVQCGLIHADVSDRPSCVTTSTELDPFARKVQEGVICLIGLLQEATSPSILQQASGNQKDAAVLGYALEFLTVTLRRLIADGLIELRGCHESRVELGGVSRPGESYFDRMAREQGFAPRDRFGQSPPTGNPVGGSKVTVTKKSEQLCQDIYNMCGNIVSSSINIQLSLQTETIASVLGSSARVASKQLGLTAAYAFIARCDSSLNLDELREAQRQLSPFSFAWFVTSLFSCLRDHRFNKVMHLSRTLLRENLRNRDGAAVVDMLSQGLSQVLQGQGGSVSSTNTEELITTQLEALAELVAVCNHQLSLHEEPFTEAITLWGSLSRSAVVQWLGAVVDGSGRLSPANTFGTRQVQALRVFLGKLMVLTNQADDLTGSMLSGTLDIIMHLLEKGANPKGENSEHFATQCFETGAFIFGEFLESSILSVGTARGCGDAVREGCLQKTLSIFEAFTNHVKSLFTSSSSSMASSVASNPTLKPTLHVFIMASRVLQSQSLLGDEDEVGDDDDDGDWADAEEGDDDDDDPDLAHFEDLRKQLAEGNRFRAQARESLVDMFCAAASSMWSLCEFLWTGSNLLRHSDLFSLDGGPLYRPDLKIRNIGIDGYQPSPKQYLRYCDDSEEYFETQAFDEPAIYGCFACLRDLFSILSETNTEVSVSLAGNILGPLLGLGGNDGSQQHPALLTSGGLWLMITALVTPRYVCDYDNDENKKKQHESCYLLPVEYFEPLLTAAVAALFSEAETEMDEKRCVLFFLEAVPLHHLLPRYDASSSGSGPQNGEVSSTVAQGLANIMSNVSRYIKHVGSRFFANTAQVKAVQAMSFWLQEGGYFAPSTSAAKLPYIWTGGDGGDEISNFLRNHQLVGKEFMDIRLSLLASLMHALVLDSNGDVTDDSPFLEKELSHPHRSRYFSILETFAILTQLYGPGKNLVVSMAVEALQKMNDQSSGSNVPSLGPLRASLVLSIVTSCCTTGAKTLANAIAGCAPLMLTGLRNRRNEREEKQRSGALAGSDLEQYDAALNVLNAELARSLYLALCTTMDDEMSSVNEYLPILENVVPNCLEGCTDSGMFLVAARVLMAFSLSGPEDCQLLGNAAPKVLGRAWEEFCSLSSQPSVACVFLEREEMSTLIDCAGQLCSDQDITGIPAEALKAIVDPIVSTVAARLVHVLDWCLDEFGASCGRADAVPRSTTEGRVAVTSVIQVFRSLAHVISCGALPDQYILELVEYVVNNLLDPLYALLTKVEDELKGALTRNAMNNSSKAGGGQEGGDGDDDDALSELEGLIAQGEEEPAKRVTAWENIYMALAAMFKAMRAREFPEDEVGTRDVPGPLSTLVMNKLLPNLTGDRNARLLRGFDLEDLAQGLQINPGIYDRQREEL